MAQPRTADRSLDGERARRIVEAMRASVGHRGAAASTFEHVAREAEVSRGLLHYYFGTKERLLVEVVRHDSQIRMRALEERLEGADSVDAVVDGLVAHLERLVGDDALSRTLLYELFSAARRHDEIRGELAALCSRIRSQVGAILRAKERAGVVRLRADAEAVASLLFALGDGLGLQIVADPGWSSAATVRLGTDTARFLLGGDP